MPVAPLCIMRRDDIWAARRSDPKRGLKPPAPTRSNNARTGTAGKEDGEDRLIAETGAGQHGVATAAAAAPFLGILRDLLGKNANRTERLS